MTKVSIEEFIKTGQFGEIKLGLTRHEVIEILGDPSNWGGHKYFMQAGIWVYGLFEFHFEAKKTDSNLHMIFTDHISDESIIRDDYDVGWGRFYPLPTMPDVIRHLNAEGLTYTTSKSFEQLIITISTSNVKLSFNDESLLLQALNVSNFRESKITHKQTTVLLPIDVYDKAKHIAESKNIKISQLCSKWLTEYIQNIDE